MVLSRTKQKKKKEKREKWYLTLFKQ